MKEFWSKPLVFLVILFLAACQSAPKTGPDETREISSSEVSAMESGQSDSESGLTPVYNDETYLALVRKFSVEGGEKVDYAAWKNSVEDMEALDSHVGLIAVVSPDNSPEQFPDRASARSYWINSYNALVLQAVLQYWPLDTVRDVKISLSSRVVPGKGFFYDREVIVGGEITNLYKLEKQVLKQQKDPRLHFALNCASSSCPVLRPWEWTDEQLDQAAREFVNKPDNVSVADGKVYLSSIFKWYKKDFPGEIVVYLQQYADPELAQKLNTAERDNYSIKYEKYDWSLNDSEPVDG